MKLDDLEQIYLTEVSREQSNPAVKQVFSPTSSSSLLSGKCFPWLLCFISSFHELI